MIIPIFVPGEEQGVYVMFRDAILILKNKNTVYKVILVCVLKRRKKN